MSRLYPLLVLAICVMAFSVTAMAAEKHEILKSLEKEGYIVDFMGNAYGMDGWVIRNAEDKAQYAYTTEEGALVMGFLVTPEGDIHTFEQVEAVRDVLQGNSQSAKPTPKDEGGDQVSKAERLYSDVEKTRWFAVGDKTAPYIYTFINPTCGHCVTYWQQQMKTHVDAGSLQIRFIPYGTSRLNILASAGLLSSDDAAEIWSKYAAGDKTAYDGFAEPAPDKVDEVKKNAETFMKWKLPSVPFTVYRAPADSEIKIINGIPANPMMILADMLK